MFNKNYPFFTSSSKEMIVHFKNYSNWIKKKFSKKIVNLVEIGSNDGTFLSNFKNTNVNVLGIEPSSNVAKISSKKGINTINKFFNFNNIKKLNSFLHTCKKNKIQNSILILNCVPKNDAIKKNLVQNWIKKALIKAKNNSIEGKELTPFLIKEVNLLSKNQCLKSNISLIINNAALAGKLAKNYY